MFGRVEIARVAPGTVVRDDLTGEETPVTDQNAVMYKGVFRVTPCVYERIKKQLSALSEQKSGGKGAAGFNATLYGP